MSCYSWPGCCFTFELFNLMKFHLHYFDACFQIILSFFISSWQMFHIKKSTINLQFQSNLQFTKYRNCPIIIIDISLFLNITKLIFVTSLFLHSMSVIYHSFISCVDIYFCSLIVQSLMGNLDIIEISKLDVP